MIELTYIFYNVLLHLWRDSMREFILATTEEVPGYRIVQTLGIVSGNAVRARGVGRDIAAGVRSVFGGEIKEYSELMNQAREKAIERMISKAKEMGANAVIGVRFTTSDVMSGVSEILVYGTAVILEVDTRKR